MTTEARFGERLARKLRDRIQTKYFVETKRSLLYAVAFDDAGRLVLGQNKYREPTRGRGTGFEQDLLIFERSDEGDTAIVPRVSVELKFGGVTTHDAIVYSEKARRIRTVYPFVRYGLILGGADHIPPRLMRLGTEFDFLVAVTKSIRPAQLDDVVKLLRQELRLSSRLTAVLGGREKISMLHRGVTLANTR